MSATEKSRHYPSKRKKEKEEHLGNIKYFDYGGVANAEPTGAFWGSENKAYMDLITIKALFQSEDWVFLSVDSIAHPISTLPIKVYDKKIKDDKVIYEVNDDFWVNKILDKPNRWNTTQEFIYGLIADYCLTGNSYAWKGDALNLYHIPAEKILYRWGDDNMPNGYYILADYDDGIPNVNFQANLREIGHTKRPNPSSALYGLSPFSPAKRSVLFNRYSQEYLNNFYLKGATPQMILSLDKTANDKSINRLQNSYEQAYLGRRNQRRTMILPKGVTAEPIENKIADQSLIELIENNADRILATLKVPKHVVSRQESGSLGSQELKESLKYFWQTTITDTATAISQTLTRLFAAELGKDKIIAFDFENVSELQDDVDAKAETSEKLLAIMTPNEIRQNFWDLPPVEGGDTLVGFSENKIEPEAPQELPEKSKKKAIKREDAQEQIDKTFDEIEDLEKTDEPKRYDAAIDLFVKQAMDAVELFSKMSKTKDFQIDEQAFYNSLDEMYGLMRESYLDGYVEDLSGAAELGYKQQVDLFINVDNREAIRAALERNEAGMYKLLEARGLDSFKSVKNTSLDAVMKQIAKGIENGDGIEVVASKIKDSLDVKHRARTIARTETLQALTVGNEIALEEAQKLGIKFQKVWISSRDNRVRPAHAAADNQKVKDGEAFDVDGEKLRYPRDPLGSASNTINCRCIMLTIEEGENFEY